MHHRDGIAPQLCLASMAHIIAATIVVCQFIARKGEIADATPCGIAARPNVAIALKQLAQGFQQWRQFSRRGGCLLGNVATRAIVMSITPRVRRTAIRRANRPIRRRDRRNNGWCGWGASKWPGPTGGGHGRPWRFSVVARFGAPMHIAHL